MCPTETAERKKKKWKKTREKNYTIIRPLSEGGQTQKKIKIWSLFFSFSTVAATIFLLFFPVSVFVFFNNPKEERRGFSLSSLLWLNEIQHTSWPRKKSNKVREKNIITNKTTQTHTQKEMFRQQQQKNHVSFSFSPLYIPSTRYVFFILFKASAYRRRPTSPNTRREPYLIGRKNVISLRPSSAYFLFLSVCFLVIVIQHNNDHHFRVGRKTAITTR